MRWFQLRLTLKGVVVILVFIIICRAQAARSKVKIGEQSESNLAYTFARVMNARG